MTARSQWATRFSNSLTGALTTSEKVGSSGSIRPGGVGDRRRYPGKDCVR